MEVRRRAVVTLVAIVTAALAASGCIGATDRPDFEAEVRARGGGVSTTWIADALDLAAVELGAARAADLDAMNLRVNSTARTVVVMARRADRPDFVDNVVVREGEVLSVSPLQDADQLPLDEITFAVGDLPIDRLEEIADEALQAFDEADAFVEYISVSITQGQPLIRVGVDSSRRTGVVVFDASGTLVEVDR